MADIIDDPIATIQDITTNQKPSPSKFLVAASYYEWNEQTQKWSKLLDEDPEPPNTLSPGKFDGQIIEIRKGSEP